MRRDGFLLIPVVWDVSEWTVPSKLDENPTAWMLEVNGFLMDIRHAPRELQEIAFEKGLIPYIPADRAEAGEEE
jgi:hypothetical protein